jgi:hypothetical protein
MLKMSKFLLLSGFEPEVIRYVTKRLLEQCMHTFPVVFELANQDCLSRNNHEITFLNSNPFPQTKPKFLNSETSCAYISLICDKSVTTQNLEFYIGAIPMYFT